MNNNEKNNQSEISAIDGLKKLNKLSSTEQVSNLFKEIQSAKRSLESLYQNVSEKKGANC